MAVDLKLNQDFLVFALRIEKDLLAAGISPAGKNRSSRPAEEPRRYLDLAPGTRIPRSR